MRSESAFTFGNSGYLTIEQFSLYALVIGLFCGRMALMALVRADGRLSGGGNGKICGIR